MCITLLAACGSTPAPASAGASAKPSAAAAKVSLSMVVSDKPGVVHHWTLRCDPPGGTHPDPAAACRVLLATKNPFGPLPKHVMCPMILANGKHATIEGRWFGTKVKMTLQDGGCDLARWTKIGQIFY
jgi:hypothetical protein